MAWGDDDQPYTSPGVPKRDVKWYLLEDVDSRAKWFTIILLLISLGMLIAGSVMLGVGISNNNNNNNNCPVNQQDSGYTMFLNVRTKSLPYSSIVNNYAGSVQNLTLQMNEVVSSSSSAQFAIQPAVPITILGISNAGQFADVMYALSYSDSNKPALSDIQKKVSDSSSFALLSATDQTAPSLNQMTCAAVADSTMSTVTPAWFTTTGATLNTVTPCGTIPTVTTNPATKATNPVTGNTNPVTTATTSRGSQTTVNTVNPPVTQVTQPAGTTTSPFVKTPYSLDVIILLDDSTAMQTAKNFNKVKSWIVNTLLPLWVVDRADVQVAFATYASTEFNTLLDFDEANENEVAQVISSQIYSGKYNSSITNGVRAAGDIHGLRPVNQTVILISASEDLTDIETATQYAYIINTLPKQLITVTLNSATNGKQLGLLSTNQNHYFGVPNFNLTTDIAQQLTQYMFGTLTPTSPPSTTTAVPDNSCKSDITILIDNNNDVGSLDEYQNQLRTIAKLIKTWPISPNLVEGQAIVFATSEGGQIAENPFAYQTASTFANEVMAYDNFYFAISPPNLTASLQYLSQNLFTRRKDREQATILFTYSSDNTDVQSSVEFANRIGGNLIVVAVGSADQTVLKQLSGNVIYSKNLTTSIIDQVNSLICSPTTRAPIVTATSPLPTTPQLITTTQPPVATSTTAGGPSTTPAPTSPTTPLPDPCPDCSPKTSNILLLLEAYGDTLQNQRNLVENDLSAKWNHYERTAVMGFDTMKQNLDPIVFGDLQNSAEFVQIVESITPFKNQPTIVSAFNLAANQAHPLQTFGKMNSVIFTSGATAAEITSALPNSQTLRKNGKVIIVGLQLQDATGLDKLCDTLLKWDDLTKTADISAQINAALNS